MFARFNYSRKEFYSILFSNIVLLYYIFYGVYYTVFPSIIFKASVFILLFINLLVELRKLKKENLPVVIFFLVLSPIAIINFFLGKIPIVTIISWFLQLGLVLTLLRTKIYILPVLLIFILYTSVVLVLNLFFGIDFNLILFSASRNMVTFIAIAILTLYYTLVIKNNSRLLFFPSVLLIVMAIAAEGRSGIIISALLFSSIFLVKQYKNPLYKLGISMFFIIIFFYIIIEFQDFFIEKLTYFSKKGFESSEREYLMNSYFDKLDFNHILLGVKSHTYPFINFNNNFHNSILLAHANFGIGFILILIFVFYRLIQKNHLLLKVLLILLLLRSLSDTVLFVKSFDFVFFFLLFCRHKNVVSDEVQPYPNAVS